MYRLRRPRALSRGRAARLAALAAAAALLACGGSEDEPAGRETTRALMREIFGALQVALPASVAGDLDAPDERAQVEAAVAALARNAELLEDHLGSADARTRALSRSAARDAREVQRTWQAGRHDRTAFLLRAITENCVACHTRLPDREDSPLANGFVDSSRLAELRPEARAALQMATRRFDDALATLEERLAAPVSPALLFGPLTDHLVVSIRVKGDYARARATMRRFSRRNDLWDALRRDVEGWVEALPGLEERAAGSADIDVARALLEEAGLRRTPPEDHAYVPHLVAASAVLERFVAEHRARDRDLGEAYFALGLVETRIGRNYWVTQAPFLLETSIRIAPDAEFARDAIAILERELLAAYEGSDIEELPPEDAARLAELRALVE